MCDFVIFPTVIALRSRMLNFVSRRRFVSPPAPIIPKYTLHRIRSYRHTQRRARSLVEGDDALLAAVRRPHLQVDDAPVPQRDGVEGDVGQIQMHAVAAAPASGSFDSGAAAAAAAAHVESTVNLDFL